EGNERCAAAHRQLADAAERDAASQARAAEAIDRLNIAERMLAKRTAQALSLCGSARTRRAELRRRGRQIETLTAKIVALEARARELAADLDDREALTTRLARDLEQVPRALRARDERIAELDAGVSDALEELLREKTARRGSRVQVPRLESVEPRAIAAREPDRRLERVRGARVQLAARSLDP